MNCHHCGKEIPNGEDYMAEYHPVLGMLVYYCWPTDEKNCYHLAKLEEAA